MAEEDLNPTFYDKEHYKGLDNFTFGASERNIKCTACGHVFAVWVDSGMRSALFNSEIKTCPKCKCSGRCSEVTTSNGKH